MFHYAFSNDLRFDKNIENINQFIKRRAELWLNDDVPSADVDKSLNNTSNSAGFYFNLKNKGNCANAAVNGNCQKVILNFIKKYQFPNPGVKNFNKTKEDGIMLAPLRTVLKLLYIAYLNEGINGYITQNEIKNFIFYNNDVAKNRQGNLVQVYNQIIEYRKSNTLPDSIARQEEREWNQEDRQLGSMLNLMCEAKCITQKNQSYRINYSELNEASKAEILDIITFNEFWEGEDKTSYYEYMEIDDNYAINVDEECNNEDKSVASIVGENIIYYGAPGTGKSYTVNEKSKDFDYVERVTFYPEYTHDDFIGCFMPVMNYEIESTPKNYIFADGTPSSIKGKPIPYYSFVDGPFTKALVHALKNSNQNVLLIIEELNRANAAAVFGEVFQLLDRKYEGEANDGESRYEISISNEFSEFLASQGVPNYKKGDKIKIPCNLSIYATMNSADQGVNPLDSAFKRRWNFVYVPISFNEVEHKNYEIDYAEGKVTWEAFATTINKQLKSKDINEDKHLGEYFVNKNEVSDKYKFASKILLYLFDDVLKFNRRGFFKSEYKTFSDLLEGFSSGKEIFDFKFEMKDTSKREEVAIDISKTDNETSSVVYEEQNHYEDSLRVAEESENEN
jgi:hypothetical protein